MARKKSSKKRNLSSPSPNDGIKGNTERERKILNSIVNVSIIMMSTMMGALTGAMVGVTGAMASGMAGAMGGEEAEEKVEKEFKGKTPEIKESIANMISSTRKDAYAQLGQKLDQIRPMLSDPVFDEGPKIIGKYDFKLPSLTEELDDGTLVQYSQLLVKQDANFLEMFKALADWMNILPKLPDEIKK